MALTGKAVDLSGAKGALNTKHVINTALAFALIGLFMLIVGSLIALSLTTLIGAYAGIWIAVSGFVTIIYSLIKLIKNILYY